jgi:Leucine Rich repeat
LKQLWLDSNDIGDVGMEAVSRALMQNNALAELTVNRNHIGRVGLASFANALEFNTGVMGV